MYRDSNAVEDAPPSVTVVRPESDQSVLPTAVIDIVAEARDDVGLEAVWITRQRHAPAGADQPSGPGGAVEPTEEPVELARTALDGARTLESRASLDLAAIGVRPGQEVWVQALATDVFTANATARDPSRSTVRRLLVISQDEFIEQIRSELAGVRQAAMSIDQQQAALREQTTRDGADAQTRRGQAQVTERVSRERAQLQRILDRIETNALDDEDLAGLIQAAARTVDEAARRSGEAAAALDEAAQAQPDGRAQLEEEQARRVEDDQRAVQEQLAQLVELLDSGEDAWVLRRKLEDLLRDQRQLRADTQQAGAETAGRAPEELSPAERSELERIVEAQRELAQRTRDTVDELREGARKLQERDPATSEGLAQAARRAEQSAASESMEQAAQQAQQNQTASASRAQEQAEQALEQMLEDLDQSQRAREEVLRRLLLSLIDSLEALINDQQLQLDALNEADQHGRVETAEPPLDAAMVRLNRNTVGVLDLAKGGGPELVSVVSLIGRASESQTRAIIALRTRPVPVERARTNEQESLERLREAKREAERIDEEMQDRILERKQRELREAYRDALRRQVELRARTGAFTTIDELSRRDAAEVRRLSEPQGEIRADLQRLLEEMSEISDARVFDYAHRRLDTLLRDAQRDLESVSPRPATRSQDSAVAILRALLESMRDAQDQGDGFREGEQGGGGGGSSQGDQPLIPGLAQLRLLREMQADLAARTRFLDESGEPAGSPGVERIGDEQQELAELGAELVEELREQQAGPRGGAGAGGD